ncbi:hypothetical protein M436DRAFT_80189 [Aureobasidium namibiae CBS 147.97]|uniref:Uncharacterized protein n=1 Tax=Aureobasidium namibiae CBS 147.97 TaxID=1043004 RepID=A0A074WNK5_9PEZI
MSSSFSQLVLDFIIFAIIHYFVTVPLMTKLLGLITGEHKPSQPSASVFETLKTFINNEQQVEQQPSPTAPFTIHAIPEEAECERCGIFLEQEEACVTRISCHCTWCAECVEECFAHVDYDLDAPLTGLSKHCEAARNLTIREIWPFVAELASDKTRRYIYTMAEIDLTKNDWMLDGDEELEE